MAYTKYKDIPNRREPLSGRDHIQHIETGLVAVASNVGGSVYQALDIWDAFDATGSQPEIGWDASTHAGWIAGIDNLLADELATGAVVKTDLGASANPDHHVYSYTAGNPDGPTALIVTGIHPEFIGIHSSMRFFEQFARSDHPAMRELRRRMRLIWVSTADPQRDYNNANGVQVNRNFDFWWDDYTDPGNAPRGPEPFSEPETKILRDLVLNEKPSIVADCHNFGGRTGNLFEVGAPSSFILSPRNFVWETLGAYDAAYNPDQEMTIARYEPSSPPHYSPYFHNWAAYQMLAQGERRPVSVTIESGVDMFGSTPMTFTSRRAVQAYAGFLHTLLSRWLYDTSGTMLTPYTYSMAVYRHAEQPTVPVSDGGGLIDTQDPVILRWLGSTPNQFGVQDGMHVPVPYAPSLLTVRASGTIQTSRVTAEAPEGRLEVALLRDGQVESQSLVWLNFPASIGTAESPSVTFYTEFTRPFTVPSHKRENKIQLRLDVNYGGGRELTVAKARMVATLTPNMPDFQAVQWESAT